MSEKEQEKGPEDKSPSLSDRLGMALAIIIFGCGFLSTGSLTHDTNMIVLGWLFSAVGVGVGMWAILKPPSKTP